MIYGYIEPELLRLKWQCVFVVGRKMSIEQRANIRFYHSDNKKEMKKIIKMFKYFF